MMVTKAIYNTFYLIFIQMTIIIYDCQKILDFLFFYNRAEGKERSSELNLLYYFLEKLSFNAYLYIHKHSKTYLEPFLDHLSK